MAKKQQYYDMVLIGGGMVGLTMACVVARQNPTLKIAVIDRDAPSFQLDEAFDGRTMAISYASSLVLTEADIWDDIVEFGAPITSIDVQDNHSPFILNFDAQDVGDRPFGHIFESRLIRHHLQKQAKSLSNIDYIAPETVKNIKEEGNFNAITLGDGAVLQAQLLIGADGRFSSVREWADIDLVELDYKQAATVFLVEHEEPHNGLAVERFMSGGPFAVLPFTDDENGRHRSSLVWTQHGKGEKPLTELSEEAFNLKMATCFDDRYGAVKLTGDRMRFPLKLYHAKEMIGQRLALIGDAAHAMHPIAGQGLNTGMQDIAVLAEIITQAHQAQKDIGANALLEEYQRARRFDVMAMIAATDVLTRLFSNNILPIRALRSVGLGAVNRIPPLKKFFMRTAMGLNSRRS